ncbi:DUF6600 domain-containing protein [Mucilaginibacter sp.]|uniref:DUF6600 domain-containing protein n=1 Tax=Mucilaginibacter sp. TaxID=1882438 RepID=UPI002C41EE57|nr:DUF6600 domain-containing protein [Mucilaginibacter sp.]HTI58758.1 DUF6600 domain-containing protein [Mucilaginibacter sp.]
MKTLNKIWGIGLLIMATVLLAPKSSMAQDEGYVTDQQFYDDLEPYGTWVSDPQYGDVWIPDASDDFRPYATNGHWVVTEYGNTWVSDYSWGWAPFHYGRWRYDDYYGWEWVPGHTWAPAWVTWRHGGGYYGWAPLTPGVSISVSFGSGYNVPDNYWVCAPEAYITSPRIYSYYAPRTRVVNIIHNTTIINNTYVHNNVTYVSGPRVADIRRVTHNNNVRVYNVSNTGRPGTTSVRNNTINIYRPAIRKAPDARPARVVDARAYRDQHPNERIAAQNQAAINRANAARLAAVARSQQPDSKVVRVNTRDNHGSAKPGRPNVAEHQPQVQQQRGERATQQQQQRAQENAQRQQQAQKQSADRTAQQQQQRAQQDAQRQQQAQQQRAERATQQQQQRAQQNAQREQQAQQQRTERAAQQQQQRAQQNAQREQQAQQQRTERAAQQQKQRAQQNAQREQQAQQQRTERAAQQQQQRAQENAQRQQQDQQQRAERAAQQQQQRAQENAQRQQQAQQQRAAQQQQQRAQQNAQRQQQAQQQRAERAAQQRQQPPQHKGHGNEK